MNLRKTILVVSLVAGVLIAARCLAQEPATVPPESIGSRLVDHPPVPVTPPNESAGQGGRKASALDAVSLARRCRLERDGKTNWVSAYLEPTDTEPAERRWMLPCALLEQMEKELDAKPGATFRVSGEMLDYHGLKFMLPQLAMVDAALGKAASRAASRPASEPAAVASAPGDSAADGGVPDEIVKRLLKNQPAKYIAVPAEAESSPQLPTAAGEIIPSRHGYMVVDRLARVQASADDGWMTVRFVSDNTLQMPPLRLLPCRMLDKAETLAGEHTRKTPVLRVSGMIFTYKGNSYLLLRKALSEHDMNQF